MMIEESNEYYAHIMGNRLSIILTAILCNKKMYEPFGSKFLQYFVV